MKKTQKTPSLILAADIHLRPTIPYCRTDKEQFHDIMFRKFECMLRAAADNQCPLVIAGDFGDGAGARNWHPWLLSRTISIINAYRRHKWFDIWVTPGQHDLPNHQLERIEESGLWTLDTAETLRVLKEWKVDSRFKRGNYSIDFFPYGSEIKNCTDKNYYRKIAVAHKMVIEDKPEWPGQEASKAKSLLAQFDYDLILTGDNHKQFVVEHDNKVLVNPGSMFRSKSDQINHHPAYYIWYAEGNSVRRIEIPHDPDAVSVDHIHHKKSREERTNAFVDSIKQYSEIGLSFEDNIKKHMEENKTPKQVQNKVWEAIENE